MSPLARQGIGADPYDTETPKKVIVSTRPPQNHVDQTAIACSNATGAKPIDRAGYHPNFRRTSDLSLQTLADHREYRGLRPAWSSIWWR
jgi:hypothetical protein